MSHTSAASRLGRWGVAMAAAAAGALTLAGTADATVFTVTSTPQFITALNTANATPGYDKIILPDTPVFPSTALTISDDLLITGNHAHEIVTDFPAIDGTFVVPAAQNFITITPGTRVQFEGLTIQGASAFGFSAVLNNGSARFDNVLFFNNAGRPLTNATGTTAVITNSLFDSNVDSTPVISSQNASLTVLNSTLVDNPGGIDATGTFVLRNSVLDNTNGTGAVKDCFFNPTSETANLDSDGSCGNADTAADPGLGFTDVNGGPTQSRLPQPGSPAINTGDNATCMTTDQRFNVRPVGTCDKGAVEVNAVEDTTPPTCVVTATRRGPDEQDVTLSDSGSGVGPNGVFGEQITITNGTVAFTGLPPVGLPGDPTRAGVVLTAVKANQSLKTNWSFIARDWAGNQRTCS